MKKIKYSSRAKEFIQKLDGSLKKRFKSKIESLAEEEIKGTFLRKPLSNYQKIRVGSYRVVFQEKEKNVIYIENIEHRSKVYK